MCFVVVFFFLKAKQSEELAKFLDLPSQPMCMADSINLDQFNDFAKLLASGEFGSAASSCPDEYLQQVGYHSIFFCFLSMEIAPVVQDN